VLILLISVSPFPENLTGSAQWRESPDEEAVVDNGPQESSYIFEKVFFFGVIVAAVALYLRVSKRRQSRDGGILGEDKSLA